MCSDKIHQGGGVAAPLAGQIFSEILPYLEVTQGNQEEIETKEDVIVPDIVGKTFKDAEKILKEKKLEIDINSPEEINKEEYVIKSQLPEAGITVSEGNKVYVE